MGIRAILAGLFGNGLIAPIGAFCHCLASSGLSMPSGNIVTLSRSSLIFRKFLNRATFKAEKASLAWVPSICPETIQYIPTTTPDTKLAARKYDNQYPSG